MDLIIYIKINIFNNVYYYLNDNFDDKLIILINKIYNHILLGIKLNTLIYYIH